MNFNIFWYQISNFFYFCYL